MSTTAGAPRSNGVTLVVDAPPRAPSRVVVENSTNATVPQALTRTRQGSRARRRAVARSIGNTPRRRGSGRPRAGYSAPVERAARHLQLLSETVALVTSSLDLVEVTRTVAHAVARALETDACFVYVHDEAAGELVLMARVRRRRSPLRPHRPV